MPTLAEHRRASDEAYLRALIGRCQTFAEMARAAGVNRTYLYRLLDRYGIERPRRARYGNRGNSAWRSLACRDST